MKFLAFVDVHEDIKQLRALCDRARSEDVDFVICAGDISWFGQGLRKSLDLMDEIGKPVYLIPGNHEEDEKLRSLCSRYKHIHCFHKEAVELDSGHVLLGYGEGGFSFEDKEFRSVARSWYGHHKGKRVILVTHGPPHGCDLDELEGEFTGNIDYRKFAERIGARLHICGHIHENAGKSCMNGDVRVVNPGWEGMLIEFS